MTDHPHFPHFPLDDGGSPAAARPEGKGAIEGARLKDGCAERVQALLGSTALRDEAPSR